MQRERAAKVKGELQTFYRCDGRCCGNGCEVPHESHVSLCIAPLMSSIHSSISCILKNDKKSIFYNLHRAQCAVRTKLADSDLVPQRILCFSTIETALLAFS